MTVVDSKSESALDSKGRAGGVCAGASAMVRSASDFPEDLRNIGEAGSALGLISGPFAVYECDTLLAEYVRMVCWRCCIDARSAKVSI